MARMRSPNFPSLSLEEAVSFAKVIWDKNRKALIPREAAAKDLGYTGLTGRSMQVLGALNQYGLVEVTAKGQTRVTQLAEDIFIGFPERVKREAVTNAGRAPTLFGEIFEKYGGDIPGENAIRSYLFQRGFTNEGVEKAIKSFNATNRYVEINGVSESYGQASDEATELSAEPDWETATMPPAPAPTQAPPAPAAQGSTVFWNNGALDFNLSSSGLAVTGKANSRKAVNAFAEKLKALAALLPDNDDDET